MYAGVWIRRALPRKGPLESFLEVLHEDIKPTNVLDIVVIWMQSAMFFNMYGVLGSIINDGSAQFFNSDLTFRIMSSSMPEIRIAKRSRE